MFGRVKMNFTVKTGKKFQGVWSQRDAFQRYCSLYINEIGRVTAETGRRRSLWNDPGRKSCLFMREM